MVLTSQARDVLFQLGEGGQGGELPGLKRQNWVGVGLYWLIVLGSFRVLRGRLLLAVGGEEGALEGDGMQWARVGVNLFGPTGHQVNTVAGVQLGFRMEGGA